MAQQIRTALLIVFTGLVLTSFGCGSSDSNMVSVSGAATWDGQPIEKGDIIFQDNDPSVVPDAGKIVDGKYTANVKPGEKTILVYATKASGEVDPAMGMAPQLQYIPAKYNDDTELSVTIPSGKEFAHDLNLVP
jgi:hypothetical protein